ncbi:hypothetical protein [Haliangium sp. UPWRP_2]|uniref:hypothetical protein n=1 Tax=Haliangium sp. UPWRP_2 TaxID=1931276 RepID=UPI0011B1E30D|nr:hypothetical protein [Haliangium sp. UPWRP_2]HNN90712.1 hypothetical protein [Pseudomonadota bacterium]
MWIALAVTVATPLYLWRRSRDIMGGFDELIAERGFVAKKAALATVFASQEPHMGFSAYAAFAGSLRPGMPFSLLLFRRTETVLIRNVPVQTPTIYVGVYLPPSAKLDETWRKPWEERAARGREDVVCAVVGAAGGFVIIWKGAPSRKNVAAHLDALANTLPSSNS